MHRFFSRGRGSRAWPGRVPFLSTGELALGEHIASGRAAGAVKAGQELRFLDLEADAGAGLGVWSQLSGVSAADMSDQVRAAAQTHFGHAGAAFVDALQCGDLAQLKAAMRKTHGAFVLRVRRSGDSGQVGRAADRFAQVAAAGELATNFGLLPWPEGEAVKAVQWVFERWADGFGREYTAEERRVFQALRAALELSSTRFAGIDPDTDEEKRQASLEHWGWRDTRTTQGDCFIIHKSGMDAIFKGVASAQTAAKALLKVGFLVPDGSPEGQARSRLQRKYRTQQRAYWVRAAFLESDLGG